MLAPQPVSHGGREGLRVLHATDTFRPNVGGLELAVANLTRAQAERGDAVAVATAAHPHAPRREDDGGLEVHRLPMTLSRLPGAYEERGRYFFPPVPDPEFARGFARLLREFRPDLVHVHGWVLYSVLSAARASGVPVVATAHDMSQVCATKTMLHNGVQSCSGPGLGKCLGCSRRHYGLKGLPLALGLHQLGSRRNRDVSAWIAISSAVAAAGSACRPADRRPMAVVPTYLDEDILTLARDERTARRPAFVPQDGPYLFFAGALSREKGVDILLESHRLLRASGVDVQLVLAGFRRPGFHVAPAPGVTVACDVPPAAVMAGWRHAAVGVVPSVLPEGFGRVAVECMAAATPCVVSATGGLTDAVADGVEGLHVPPGDAIALAAALRRLLSDEDLRTRLGAAGPPKAARFTLAQVLPQVDAVYRAVLSPGSHSVGVGITRRAEAGGRPE
jgi:glycosyltransferase involved in cell wall biosynthesis